MNLNKVKAIEVTIPTSISQILSKMSQTGFQGKKLAEVTDIIERMIKDETTTIMMGLAVP